MSESYDVVIIGAGPGGYNCATRCGQLGLKVALIEKRDKLGGTCLNVGCIPSKALLHASELYETAGKDFAALGIEVTGLKLNLDNMLKQKADAVTGLTNGVAFIMKKNKVTVYNGAGRIDGPGRVVVTGEKGETVLEAKNIVIATGSVPIAIPGFPFDEKDVWSSTGALAPTSIPKRLVVIGGGYIGLELGMMYAKLGSEVTVLEATAGALPGQDRDCVKVIERTMKKLGMKLLTETFAQGYERKGAELKYKVYLSHNSEDLDLFRKTDGPMNKRTYKALPGFDFDYTLPVSKTFGLVVTGLSSNQFNEQHRTQNTYEFARAEIGRASCRERVSSPV